MVLSERIDRLDMVVKGLDAILLAIHDEPDVVFCRKELTTFKYFFQQRLDSLKTTQTFVAQKNTKEDMKSGAWAIENTLVRPNESRNWFF